MDVWNYILGYRNTLKSVFETWVVHIPFKGLKDNKSPGADGISPRLLKEIVDDISVPLAIAFNLSIQDGIVPREWKNAIILYLSSKRAVDVSLKTTDQLV